MKPGRVLIVAGSDSGGGAGIQADLKTVVAFGGFGMTAITALTAQNTLGVSGIVPVPPDFVALQMQCVLDDLGADVIKIGMLPDTAVMGAVAEIITAHSEIPYVLDPVMVASSGASLMNPSARALLLNALVPGAALVTPNIPEAEALTGLTIRDPGGMKKAAETLLEVGAHAVLIKGGHLDGQLLTDVLLTREACFAFESERIISRATHGTGCTLSSGIATALAGGYTLVEAVSLARRFVRGAIMAASPLGGGVAGPMAHEAIVIGPRDWIDPADFPSG
ncbi:bifunctional hydroxymethylpyrimidine kinase/phosphomethylpyrimidine kinase [Acidomonas methanolica]|uniref:hydroxymethylpyrimidine kinase n=1 Tax=Acidomonas methanolica NBRC 104435 TaxID=1231351 RepID=A0A023D123_ACIMT|nr:bifunctional hydroxymethylpyrimidine kinase/phosphomethylpyrimidine kinase [Acidomonas methanolica]MBU2653427.1 bifunctional hydroxymethylpyrimidine kinase/phosphomethylpyrimidine kinase [Acidomonas methanolica]TCS32379.1 hydroxymethylpyrimidine/phosphomethylpyrimidine kinase [Acidomonas methanolica]GAJ27754.1 phosphomethylpyrimidine kinase [Acidomonas methanolica NBRC 104435]GBQ56845.1 phosphomethylpyrimidine kinase [Acidomonas methanolica]GEK97816.1 hydroxymethylpyrimidine/phosphomethylpy